MYRKLGLRSRAELAQLRDHETGGLRATGRHPAVSESHALERRPARAPGGPVLRRAPRHSPASGARLDAVVLDVDVDGFTAASERLAGEGVGGTERVRDALNDAFGTMLATVDRHGGHVLQFRGDALTALFPTGQPRPDGRRPTGRRVRPRPGRAARAGGRWDVDRQLDADGARRGPVTSVVAGDPAHGLLVVTTGVPLRRCAEGAARAPHGAVVADRTLADVPGLRLGRAVGGGFRRVEAWRACAPGQRAAPAPPRRGGRRHPRGGLPPRGGGRSPGGGPARARRRAPAGHDARRHGPARRAAPGATMTAIARTVGALGGRVLQADVDAAACAAWPSSVRRSAARTTPPAPWRAHPSSWPRTPRPASGSRREPPSAGWWAARCGSTTRCSATW